ncbi:hypothetical protein EVG20_g7530 [Dentipellis fragilis]|uniref:Uncharacterized protein n=1 Tax=Dentipellis fragilis TaxID=205917 RepID=A0A4Y9YDP7_9AGAM|nr:hypothetical protein EVG20_g7530 [Dentipellis fragilis]
MSGFEPAVGIAVHFTDIIAGAMYQAVVGHLPGRQMKAGDKYMAHAFDVIEKHRKILPVALIHQGIRPSYTPSSVLGACQKFARRWYIPVFAVDTLWRYHDEPTPDANAPKVSQERWHIPRWIPDLMIMPAVEGELVYKLVTGGFPDVDDLSEHYRSAQDSTERYSRAKNVLRSWGASHTYKAKAKATMKLAEIESSKARAKYLFASQVADQFVRIVEDQSTETLTNEEMEYMHSKAVESALELTLSVLEGKTSVEVNAIAADTAKLACQALGDPNTATKLPNVGKGEGTDAEKTLDSIAE